MKLEDGYHYSIGSILVTPKLDYIKTFFLKSKEPLSASKARELFEHTVEEENLHNVWQFKLLDIVNVWSNEQNSWIPLVEE